MRKNAHRGNVASATSNDEDMEEDKESGGERDQLNRSFESTMSKRGRPAIPDQWTGLVLVEPVEQPIPVKIR